MTIINKLPEFNRFLERWRTSDCFVDYVLTDDNLHPSNNSISLILIKFIDGGDVVVLPLNHNEAEPLPVENLLSLRNDITSKTFVVDRKKIRQSFNLFGDVIDLSVIKYLTDGTTLDLEDYFTESHNHINQLYGDRGDVNTAIPLLKWVEWFESVYGQLKVFMGGEINKFYNNKFISTIADVEANGLFVDPDKFTGNAVNISPNGLVYTRYNLFTSTGRPSNNHGGVNFSALPKSDGSRDAFTSRFGDDGELVMFDYASYHPHLVSHLIKYTLPDENVYDWLGKQYLDVDELTDEEYAFAKTETFRQFYGGVDDKYAKRIPYLNKISKFVNKLWDFGTVKGYIPSPISGRKIYLDVIDDVHKYKLFNYLLQLYETEMNVLVMSRVNSILKPMQSKLILYTYDAFLFDVHMGENLDTELVSKLAHELNPMGRFPLRTYVGESYGELEQIDIDI